MFKRVNTGRKRKTCFLEVITAIHVKQKSTKRSPGGQVWALTG